MKLHLPTGLRKALLVCLAAVALPAATIPTTVASASGIAAAFLIASQPAKAEAINHTGSDTDVRDLSGAQTYESITISDGEVELDIAPGDATKVTVTGELAGTGGTLTLKRKDGDGAAQLVLEQGGNFNGTLRITEGVQSNGWANPIVEMGGSLTLGSLELDSCGGRFQFFTTTPSTLTITNKVTLDGSDYLKIDASAHGAIGGTHKVTFTGGVSVEAGSELHISDAEVIVGPSQKITSAGTVSIVGNITGGGVEVRGGMFTLDGTLDGDLTLDGQGTLGSGEAVNVTLGTTIKGNFISTVDFAWYGRNADSKRTLTLEKGGKITGNFTVGWGGIYVMGDDLEIGGKINIEYPGSGSAEFQKKDDATDAAVVFNLGEGDKTLSELLPTVTSFDVGIGATGAHKLTIADYTVKGAAKAKEGATLEFTGASAVEGKLMGATGTTVNVASGGTLSVATLSFEGGLSLAGQLSVSAWEIGKSLTSLTFAEGGHLKLGGGITEGAINLGAISLSSNADIMLEGTLTSLKLQGTLSDTGHNLTIHLTREFLQSVAQGGGSYTLIESDTSAWKEHATFADVDGYSVSWGDNGSINVSSPISGTETWSGSEGSMEWTSGGIGWGAGHDQAYNGTGNVEFAGTSAGEVTITVSDDITVRGDLTFRKGEGGSGLYVLSAAAQNRLTVSGQLIVEEGAAVELQFAHDAQGTYKETSGIRVAGTEVKGTLTLGGGNQNGIAVKSLGQVDVSKTGKLVVSQAWNIEGVTGVRGDGWLVFNAIGAGDMQNAMKFFVKGGDTAREGVIQNVEFDSGSSYDFLSKSHVQDFLAHVTNIWVGAGSTVTIDEASVAAHQGTTVHLRGSGVENQNHGILAFWTHGNYNKESTSVTQQEVKWNITLEGDGIVQTGMLDDGEYHHKHVMQYTGSLINEGGHTLVKKGIGVLELAEGFTATGAATIDVQQGTLKLSYSGDALSGYTVQLAEGTMLESGITGTVKALTGTGTLNVTAGELTLTDATSSTLTSLQLAAGAKLTVSKGNFAIANALSWGEGSVLKLGAKLTIDLTGVSSLTAPEGAHKLKIDLASDALDQNNSYQLFSGWREDWNSADLFEFTINGQAVDTNTYADLRLNSEGKLEWGGSSPAPEELTWYTPGEGNTWGTSGTGWGEEGTAAWNNQGQTTAVFNDTTGEEVTISGALKAAVVQVKGGGQMWGFKVGRDDSLTVNETLNVGDSTKLAISGEGGVDVKGGVALGVGSSVLLKESSRLTTGKTWTFGSNSGVQMESDSTLVYTFSDSENFLSLVKTLSTTADATGAMLELAGTEDVSVTVNENITFATGLKKTEGGITLTALEAGQSITIGGEIDVKSLSWIGADGDDPNYLTLKKGGRIRGDLALTKFGTLILEGDLVVEGEIQTGVPAEDVYGTGNEYLLVARSGEMPWDKFLSSYRQFGRMQGVGMGKAGVEELIISDEATLENNFKVSEGTVTFRGTVTIIDKKLALSDGATVNFNGGIAASLTALTLGSHAKMSIASGETLTLKGGFSWGQGAILDLGSKLTIALDGGSLTKPGAQDLLTIDLSADVLSEAGSGNWQLFSGWNEISQWSQYIDFTVDGSPVNSEVFRELKLNESGYLTWVSSSLPEGADAFTEIVYSNTITNEEGQVVNGNTTVDVEEVGEVHSVAAFTMTSGNLRVVAKGSADTSEFKVGKGEDIDMSNLDSVYFTGTGYFTDANCFNAHHPKTIYVKGAQLYFSAWGTGVSDTTEVDLGDTDFVIGTSTGGHADMGHGDAGAALAFGKSVSTTGSLTVKDGDAAISLYSSGESVDFSVGEVRSENHTLTLRAYSDAKSRNVERSFTITSGGVIKKLISERDDDKVIKINLTSAGVIELKEGGKISGTLHGDGSAGLKVSSGELSVGVASGSLSALTLGSGAKVSVGAGTLAATTLMLDGSCTLAISGEAKLDLGAVNSGANTLEIDLTGLTWAGDNTYQLFTGNSLDYTGLVTGGHLTFTGYDEEYEVRLDNQGKLTLVSLAGGYIYDGSKDLIWDDSTSTNTGWQTDQAYENNASVQFTANEGTHAVKVGSDVVAGSLRVTGRAKYNVTSSADGAAHLLIVKNKMELVAGSELSFSKDVQLQLDGTASLADGSKLAVSSNINLGDTGRFDGTGSIEKGVDVNQAYVQFRVNQGAPNVQKTVDAWVTEKLGGVTLGEGVGLQKTGEGILNFQDTGGTLNYDLDIAEGAVQFNGNNYTLKGKLTGQGNFSVATAALGSAPTAKTLIMEKGGSISGDMALSGWGARLQLNADLEVGGITKLENMELNVNADNNNTNNRFRTVLSQEEGTVNLTVNVASETKEVDGLVIEQGVTLVKKGAGTQKFTTSEGTNEAGNGKTQLQGSVKVDEGVLEFEGAGSVISGALSNTGGSTSGTLKLTNGDLTISGGGKHGGALELTAGTITISGATLEVGTFKATEGELDVQSNLTIGYGANEGLSTLKIASGTKVTLKGGTLKAESLDLTGTQGASLSIDMTGQAKLDFGGITLGTDGKLAIELTGDNGDMGGYQLFEISSFGSVWDALVTDDKTWEDVFDITVNGENDKVLGLNREGWLDMETTGMEWNGGGTWSDTSGSQWEGGKTPNGEDVRFTEQGAQKDGTVRIEGKVAPRNVYVDGGEYTFTQQGGTEGGLNMSSIDGGGVLRVRDAKLTLKLKNTAIPEIQLKDQGTLVLAHDGALPGDSKIKFQGGVLEYSNAPLANSDVSRQIASAEEGSEAVVKVSVDGTTYTNGVTWGSASTAVGDNSGLKLALNEKGIEKSGAGDFTLAWRGTGDTHEGSIAVNEGSLTLNVSNATTLSGTISGSGTLKITGGEVTLSGGNNTVANIQVDSGATLKAGRANALGGADTTLTLNGGNLSGNNVSVNAGQVRVMEAATLSGVTLAGTVTGEEAMSAGSGTAGLSGDISGYTGELTGTGTWKLSGKALEKPVTNAVSGSGIVSFAGESVYGGDVKGSVTLEGGGENGEQLVITSRTTSNGAKLKGQVTLGNQGEQSVWQGSTLVNGEITLANVELVAGDIRDKGSAKLYVNTATSAATVAEAYGARAARRGVEVNVNGMSGEQLDGITINEHGRLTGITGSYTADANHKLELHFAGENVGESATVGEGESALITGESDFSLNAESKDNVELWLSSDAVASIIGRLSEADGENGEMADVYLHLLQGGDLTIGEVTLSDLKGSDAELLERLDVTEVRVEGGSIRLVGTAADVFVVNETSTLTDAAALGTSKSTVLSTPGVELTLNLDGGTADDPEDNRAIVNNLLGVTGSQLHLQNSSQDDPTGANRLEVTFHNAKVSVNDKDKYPSVDDTTVEGQHTTFNGSIDGGEGVDVKKTGFGTLSVGGDYTLEDGTTTITAGALKLRGAKNTINGLAFDYADVQQQKDKGEDYRGLLLDGGRTTVRGSITEGEKKTGEIVMSSGAELVLNGESDLEGTSITGDDSTKLTLAVKGEQRASLKLRGGKNVSLGEDGKRTVLSGVDVEVQEGASMEVSGIDAAMKGSDLTVQGGELKLTEGATMMGGSATLIGSDSLLDLGSSAQNTLTALNGTGTLKSAAGGNTTITGEAGPSVFSGKLASTVEGAGAGKLTISRNADVTLDNVDTSAAGGNTANAWDVEVQDGGKLTLDVSKSKAGEQVVLGDVNFGSGNTVNLKVNSSNYNLEGSTVKGNTLSFGENTMVMLEAAAGDIWNGSGGRELTLGEWDAVKGGGEDIDVQLRGDGFIFADVKGVVVEGTTVIVQLEGAKENKFERAMPNGEKNAMAGATMVWGSLKDKSELDSFVDMLTNSESDYARVIHGLVTQMDNGQTGSLQNALASVAGSSVATIGPAVMEDLHRQIKTIRNRTTTMATEATYDNYDQLPLWHAWINGEGGYHKMDADSQAPGYTLNNWGGTVGVDVDMSPQATMGLAITAMYGNLKPESVDAATGNVDMTYLSGFVRATGGAWIHTFVMSGGKADVQLDRTVNYGTGSYRTRGSTDGYVLGAMYEVGYTRLFSASGTFALQPVFNVEARHASIKGYTETGSDAGLHVDEISQDVITFGLGARMQSLVGENSFNRTAIFEARLLLKADVGDRSGTADNTLLGAVTSAEVESAEVGAIGVEVGAGLTIPLGSSSGSIFMDASVECRRGWTSLDASAGYRISF